MKKTMRRTEKVQTVLSSEAVTKFEDLLHWLCDETGHECIARDLMQMLEVYTNSSPCDVPGSHRSIYMMRVVSEIIQFNERLMNIREMERPWTWIESPDGWSLPIEESSSE